MSTVIQEAKIDARQAMSVANRFIVQNLPDRFSAGLPKKIAFPTRLIWVVPVLLTYPNIGIVGEVGMIAVEEEREAIVGWTPLEEMEELARQLYEEHKDEIELAFL